MTIKTSIQILFTKHLPIETFLTFSFLLKCTKINLCIYCDNGSLINATATFFTDVVYYL